MSKGMMWLLMVVLLTVGVYVSIWTSDRAHQYYYPEIPGSLFQDSSETFTFNRTGRYEITMPSELGDLTCHVVEKETGAEVSVHEFSMLSKVVQTTGSTSRCSSQRADGT